MVEQTFVSSQVPDSVPVSLPCIATWRSKFTLKQAANNERILRTEEKNVRFNGWVLSITDWLRFPVYKIRENNM